MKKVFTLSALFFTSVLFAQPALQWARNLNGTVNAYDIGQKIYRDAAGNFYVTGYTDASGYNDILTIKYSSTGIKQWSVTWGNPTSSDYGRDIVADASGNVYVAGQTFNAVTSSYDIVLLKYGSTGKLLWASTYNGTANSTDDASAMVLINDCFKGKCYTYIGIVGRAYNTGSYDDVVTLKYDVNGSLKWARNYNGTANGSDVGYGITSKSVADGSVDLIVTGYAKTTLTNTTDIVTIRYDYLGTQLWAVTYNGNATTAGSDYGQSVVAGANGDIFVGGYTYNTNTLVSSYDAALLKYDAAGKLGWVRFYNGSANSSDYGRQVTLDGAGYVYLTGNASITGSGYDILTVKYSIAGALSWARLYNGTGSSSDYGNGIQVDGSSNVYVTGYAYNTNTDIVTIKYNSAGTQQWAQPYAGSGAGSDYSYSLVLDPSGNTYSVGKTYSTTTRDDAVIIKNTTAGTTTLFSSYNSTGSATDEAKVLALDAAGNSYVTGRLYSTASADDISTAKYDKNGVLQWSQIFNGTGNSSDIPYSIVVDANGNAYITGYTYTASNYPDIITMKYNAAGTQQWAVTYNGNAGTYDYGYDLWVDGSGNVYVTGQVSDTTQGYNMITLKYSSTGSLLWNKRYNGTANSTDRGTAILSDVSGNVYVTGYAYNTSVSYDVTTIKYDSNGNQQWVKTYNGSGNSSDEATDIAMDGSNNIYVTGKIYNATSGDDIITIKYDNNGNQQWATSYNGAGSDRANGMVLNGGSVYVAGRSYNASNNDAILIKYNSSGVQQWVSVYNNVVYNGGDEAKAITADTSGNIFLAGYSAAPSYYDLLLLKYNSSGSKIWEKTYSGVNGRDDIAYTIAIDNAGGIYTAGVAVFSGVYGDMATLKYCDNTALPVVTPGGALSFCEGGSVSLDAPNGFSSYLWNTGATTQNIVADSSGEYSVTVSYPSGCSATSDPITVTEFPLPSAAVSFTADTLCQGDSTVLTSVYGDETYNYLWNTGDTTSSITVLTSGFYKVTLTDTNGCSATSDSVHIQVNALPGSTITPDGPTVFCIGDSVVLTAPSGISYLWSNGDTLQDITVKSTGSFSVTVTNLAGCTAVSNTVNVSVSSAPKPTVTPQGPTTFCQGGSVTLASSTGSSYSWSNGSSSSSIIVTASGKYAVTVTNSNPCDGTGTSDSIEVIVYPLPAATITSGGATNFCTGSSVLLTASGDSTHSWLWNTAATSSSIVVTATGSYSVTVTDTNSCSNTSAPVNVTVNPVPSVSLCMVTVDTSSTYNQVIWEKPVATDIDSFRIYREGIDTTGSVSFISVGTTAYTASSVFTDSTSNPNATYARYKITAIDTCGNESPLSNEHKTMFLQANLGVGGVVNLNWAVYEGTAVNFYRIMRDDNGTGNFLKIDSVPFSNNLFTDNNPPASSNVRYAIEVVWQSGCNATLKMSTTLNTSRSNIKSIAAGPTSLPRLSDGMVKVYPNPAASYVTVEYPVGYSSAVVAVYDMLGQGVIRETFVIEDSPAKAGSSIRLISTAALHAGVYLLTIEAGNERVLKKLIIE